MKPLYTWVRRRVAAGGDDRGAVLIYTLIFMTVIAIGVAAVLTLADTNLRTTVRLRDQAAEAAAADGAAQVAIDTLRHGTYAGASGQCFGGSDTQAFNGVYTAPGGGTYSTAVVCTPDPDTSIGTVAVSQAPAALMTLEQAPPNGNWNAIDVKVAGGTGRVWVQGNVRSMAKINVDNNGDLKVTGGTVRARRSCSNGGGGSAGTITVTPAATCNDSTLTNPPLDPGYPLPPPPTNPRTPPSCSSLMVFQPGLYTSLSALNTAFNCPTPVRYDFRPGIYYFSFSGKWVIDQGTLIGGRLAPLTSAETLNVATGVCESPMTAPAAGAGVQFVFGGAAQMDVTLGAKVELCGRTSLTTPPIVVYGLNSSIGSGANLVPALSACFTSTTNSSSCGGVVMTDNQSAGVQFYVRGLIYTPNAKVELDSRGPSGGGGSPAPSEQIFNGGIIAREMSIFAPASTTVSSPMIAIPSSGTTYTSRLVSYLTVYVCAGTVTCTSGTGTLRLKAKVGFTDPTGTPTANRRQVTIYSWSFQR
jgi:hypothetical protein